jgi:hypothetical protein
VPNSASKKELDIAKALEKRGYGEASNIDKSLLRPNEEIEHNNIILRNNQIQLDKMKQNTEHEASVVEELKKQNIENNRKL